MGTSIAFLSSKARTKLTSSGLSVHCFSHYSKHPAGQLYPALPSTFPPGDGTLPANKIYMLFCPFWKALTCNLLVAYLKNRINVFIWLSFLIVEEPEGCGERRHLHGLKMSAWYRSSLQGESGQTFRFFFQKVKHRLLMDPMKTSKP